MLLDLKGSPVIANKYLAIIFLLFSLFHLVVYTKIFGIGRAVRTLFFLPIIIFDAIRERKKLLWAELLGFCIIISLIFISSFFGESQGKNVEYCTIEVRFNDELYEEPAEKSEDSLNVIFEIITPEVARLYAGEDNMRDVWRHLFDNLRVDVFSNGHYRIELPQSDYDNNTLFDLLIKTASGQTRINGELGQLTIKLEGAGNHPQMNTQANQQ